MGVIDGLRMESDEVLYRCSQDFCLTKDVLTELCAAAEKNPRRRMRICCHEGPESGTHEMIILHHRDAYIPPHRHLSRDESLIVISGAAQLIFFSETGAIESMTAVTEFAANGSWYTRISSGAFHTLVIESEWLLFMEVTSGPFDPATSERASWAPIERWNDGVLAAECDKYLASLREAICSKE